MLILSRKVNESVIITDEVSGEEVVIMVTDARGPVKIGFTASQRFRIVRSGANKTDEHLRSDNPI